MKSNVSVKQVLSLVIVTLVGVICSVCFHFSLVLGFLPGFLVLVVLAKMQGNACKEIINISLGGLKKTKIVIFILFFVSFLLPSWYLSGTIGQMVKVALHFMTPSHFILLSFIIAMVFSCIIGTCVGTLSSIGMPILSSAMFLHIPVPIVAGALVSGAFVGDRTSPFSSSHQLLSNTIEVSIKKQFRAMLLTTAIAIVLCLLFYGGSDFFLGKAVVNSQPLNLEGVSIIKFFPPLVLIIFVLLRFSIVYAFASSILTAVFIALFNGTPLLKVIHSLWQGVDGLGGGLIHMYELLLFLGLAGAYNGLLEELDVIQPYINRWLGSSRSLVGDTLKLIAATLLISLIAANQTLPIILTGRSFLSHWSRTYGNNELARVMGDSTMLFPGMIPWSVLSIMCSSVLGVPLAKYLPFALFLFALPVLTLLYSYFRHFNRARKERSAAA